MTDLNLLLALGALVVCILGVRGAYRRIAYSRGDRAFLALVANTSIPTAHAKYLINLARAKRTNVMAEVAAEADAIRKNELAEARRQAAYAVMERAARDEFKRLTIESDLGFEQISEAADAAGAAMVNQYAAPGGPLAEDSPMGVEALSALIKNCNDDLQEVSEGKQYVTQVGRVAAAAMRKP